MNFSHRTPLILSLVITTVLSGCNSSQFPRPQRDGARLSVPADSPNITPVVSGEPESVPTPEEARHQKAEQIVAENPPNTEMSREEMRRLIDETEKKLPLEKTARILPPAKKEPAANPKKTEPAPAPMPKVEAKPPAFRWPGIAWPLTPPKKEEPKAESRKPAPVPVPAPSVPKKSSPPKTETLPADSNATTDTGVDADDKKYADTYAGPTTVVDHPHSTGDFQLSEIAAQLGAIRPRSKYLDLQKELVANRTKSCNFFFAVALIEARAPDAKGQAATSSNYPSAMAAQLDKTYFIPAGWRQIKLAELKQWFRDGKTFDVAIQRGAPEGKRHGHVAIPIGLNADGNVMVSEASYLTESNRISVYPDASLASKFRIFVRD